MISRPIIINEKSDIIPIKQNTYSPTYIKDEYSLKQNFFDPFKSSPPNEFMLKLRARMSMHNSPHNNPHTDIKVNNRDKA